MHFAAGNGRYGKEGNKWMTEKKGRDKGGGGLGHDPQLYKHSYIITH